MRAFLVAKLPSQPILVKLYAVIVFVVFSWTLYASFWKLPSWMFFLSSGQIFSIYAYSFLFNLLESLIYFSGILLMMIVIPTSWKGEHLLCKSITFFLFFSGSIMLQLLLYRDPNMREVFIASQKTWWGYSMAIIIFAVWLLPKWKIWRHSIEAMAENCIIFLYIYIPLGILSAFTVLFRNIV